MVAGSYLNRELAMLWVRLRLNCGGHVGELRTEVTALLDVQVEELKLELDLLEQALLFACTSATQSHKVPLIANTSVAHAWHMPIA